MAKKSVSFINFVDALLGVNHVAIMDEYGNLKEVRTNAQNQAVEGDYAVNKQPGKPYSNTLPRKR